MVHLGAEEITASESHTETVLLAIPGESFLHGAQLSHCGALAFDSEHSALRWGNTAGG